MIWLDQVDAPSSHLASLSKALGRIDGRERFVEQRRRFTRKRPTDRDVG